MSGVFGPTTTSLYPTAGSHFVQAPPQPFVQHEYNSDEDDDDRDDLVEWCRHAATVLKREKSHVTEEITRSINLYRGGTPWWRDRPSWKIGSRFNFCFLVPVQWAAILCDNSPSVTYAAYRQEDQRIADIATAAFRDAYERGGWQQRIRNAVLNARIQKKSALRLTFDPLSNGGSGEPMLTVVSGEQLFVDKNATCIDDAEVIMYEYRESANKVFSRYPNLRQKIMRKRSEQRSAEQKNSGEQLAPPMSMALPSGSTVQTPPYAATANAPDNAGGTSGLMIREFWTRPRKTVKIKKVLFTAAGEPATREKHITYIDGTSERLRRVITEGNVIYEWPESYVDIVRELQPLGGLRILDELDALEVIKHTVEYPLYPHGRLTVTVDEEFKADDRMNPLGYIPFIEIDAYPDGTQFWGQSDIDIIADAYEYFIRLMCMLLDSANLTANAIWRIPLGSEISDEDITNAPGAVQREDLQTLRYGKREPGPDMPQYVMQLLDRTEALMQKLSGLNDISMGNVKAKAQQSTESLSMQQDAAGVRFRDALHNLTRAMSKLGEQFLELMTRFYTTPRLLQIKSEQGIPEAIPLLGSHLVAPLKVQAKPGSMMPTSPTARLNFALNLLASGKPVVDLPEIWQLLQQAGQIESASALEQRIEKYIKDPSQLWKITGQLPGMQPAKQQPTKQGSKRNRSGRSAA